ncbi:MAG: hypothetical protein JW751_04825 [Polyangiaceae bacterium]|nr:hypothetical protein [Polyangiaceae bacterium]
MELLCEVATAPQQPTPTPEIDPLQARRDDVVGGDLTVESVLGQGATSRVLKVLRRADNRYYALKCSLGEDHDPRLREEAAVLRKLHENEDGSSARARSIVRLVEERTIAGRTCLLMTLAGEHTLYRELATDGVVSLDYAMRYGEKLFEALETLEDRGVIHRDLKPANVGVGAVTKGKKQLTVFDFSLAGAALTQLEVGTAAYRDSFLRLRGAWDAAADRWAAAVTLHEMLTGVRSGFGSGKTALDPDAAIELAAERFDPSVRTRLGEFFAKALRRDAEQRFDSATAMRRAWIVAFGESSAPIAIAAPPSGEAAPPPAPAIKAPAELTVEQLAAITDDTPVQALPLSARARNALDRACVLRAGELLRLPENQLSAVRGVGSTVTREILDWRRRWCDARHLGTPELEPFFPGYRGDDLLVGTSGFSLEAATALEDAGLATSSRLAGASPARVAALAQKHGLEVAALRRILEEEHGRAGKREYPTTVEAWTAALLPRKAERATYLELLYGLVAPFAGRLDVRAAEVAKHLKVTRARIYQVLADARTHWEKHGSLSELRRVVHALVEAAGGALPLKAAAEQLVSALSVELGTSRDLVLAHAAGLAKIVAEVEKTEPEGLRTQRLADQATWLLLGDELGAVLGRLGAAADELAARPVLPSPGEIARQLQELVVGSSLARLTAAQLVELAAQASHRAASSPRLELYPRAMPAERALELSATVLTSPLTEEQVAQRVRARYPEAASLPLGEPLRALLRAHGLEWNPYGERFERPGERSRVTLHTSYTGPVTYLSTASTSQPRDMDPVAIAARELDEQLDHALDRRLLRVLGVGLDRAQEAAHALCVRKGLRLENLDARLLAAMRALMREKRINEAVVHTTDREGPGSKGWRNLRKLAEQAAEGGGDRDPAAAGSAPAPGPARPLGSLRARRLPRPGGRGRRARREPRHVPALAEPPAVRPAPHQRRSRDRRRAPLAGPLDLPRVAREPPQCRRLT